jgi:hypothetical protein
MRITTHLDDERNMKKSTLELVDEVAANRQPGSVTYGILFSFFHCVIVRVDAQNGFKSTAALQFLPSFYATSSSTPGITAIGSLAYHCLDTVNVDGALNTIPPDHFLHQVPLDVLENIAALLGPSDLEALCAAAQLFEPAAESVLRFPHIADYRLIGANLEEKNGRPSLRSKAFTTMVQGSFGPAMIVGESGTQFFAVSLGTGLNM